MSVPLIDSKLVPFGTNFGTRISANPSLFNLVAADATQYMDLLDPYVAAVNAINIAKEAGARTKNMTQVRDAAKAALLPYARQLYATIQSDITVSDANKVDLGIVIRKAPEPIPVPEEIPEVDIASVVGLVVKIRIHSSAPDAGRGFPPKVSSAAIYTYIGAEAPENPSLYTFQGLTTRSLAEIEFPPGTPPGSLVWISAQWGNSRGQFGIGSSPRSFTLQGGPAVAAA